MIQATLTPQPETETWKVERHGGTRKSKWRVIYEGGDQERACEVFNKERAKMRQGAIKLVNPSGEVVEHDSAPCLRTRW